MQVRRNAFAVVLGFALVGCSESSKSIVGPQLRPPAGGVTADRVGGDDSRDDRDIDVDKAVEWVRGSIVFMAAPDSPEHIINVAKKNADGVVQGRFEARDPTHEFRGTIVCFSVVGNTVRLAGRAESSNAPLVPPGTYVIWSQVDNDAKTGKGKKAPDQTSQFVLANEGAAMDHCNVGLNVAPFYPVTKGHVEIHPEPSEHKH